MGKSTGTNTVTQAQSPWAPATPSLNNSLALANAASNYVAGTPASPGTPSQLQWIPDPGYTASTGGKGTGHGHFGWTPGTPAVPGTPGIPLPQRLPGNLIESGADVLGATIRGDYLNGNPYIDAIMRRVGAGVNSQFEGGSRYGSGAYQDALANSYANLLYNNYASERANQLAAVGSAPAYEQAPYALYSSMVNAPYENAQRYQSLIGPIAGAGGTGSMTQPYYSNSALAAIGGLSSLATGALAAKNLGLFGGAAGAAGAGAGAGLTAGIYGSMYPELSGAAITNLIAPSLYSGAAGAGAAGTAAAVGAGGKAAGDTAAAAIPLLAI